MDELVTRIYLNVDDMDLKCIETDIYTTESLVKNIHGKKFRLYIRENSKGFFIGSASMAYFREHGIPPVIENLIEEVEHMFTLPRTRRNSLPIQDLDHEGSQKRISVRDSPLSDLLLRVMIVAPNLKEMLKLKDLAVSGELRTSELRRKSTPRKTAANRMSQLPIEKAYRIFDHNLINRIQSGSFVAHECTAYVTPVDDDGEHRPHLLVEIKGPTQTHISKCYKAIKHQADSSNAA